MNETLRKQMEEMAEQYAVECRGYDIKYDNVPIAKAIRTCYEKGFTACFEIYEAKLEQLYSRFGNELYEVGVDHEDIPGIIKALKELE